MAINGPRALPRPGRAPAPGSPGAARVRPPARPAPPSPKPSPPPARLAPSPQRRAQRSQIPEAVRGPGAGGADPADPGHRPLAPASWAPEAATSRYPPPPPGQDRCPSPAGLPGRTETPHALKPGRAPSPQQPYRPGQAAPLCTPGRAGPCPPAPRARLRVRWAQHSRLGPGEDLCPQPSRPDIPAWPQPLSPGPSPPALPPAPYPHPGRRLPAGAPLPVPRPPPGAGGERAAAGGAARGGGGGASAASSSGARAGGGAGRGRGPSRLAPARALAPRSGAPQGGLPRRRPRPPRRGGKPLDSGFFLSILPTHRK